MGSTGHRQLGMTAVCPLLLPRIHADTLELPPPGSCSQHLVTPDNTSSSPEVRENLAQQPHKVRSSELQPPQSSPPNLHEAPSPPSSSSSLPLCREKHPNYFHPDAKTPADNRCRSVQVLPIATRSPGPPLPPLPTSPGST